MTRGLRNNNPGNIRKSDTTWIGQVNGEDPEFVTFSSVEYGYRALFILLKNYISKGYNTISLIINRYAPSSENNTTGYIKRVVADTGIENDKILSFDNERDMIKLVAAISLVENGKISNFTDVTKGYELASGKTISGEIKRSISLSIPAILFITSCGIILFKMLKL